MQDKSYVPFTEEMKRDSHHSRAQHAADALQADYQRAADLRLSHGAAAERAAAEIAETGLKYVHNDTCYPAMLVIGQFIDAIENEGYDPDKTAVLITRQVAAAGPRTIFICCARPCARRAIRRCRCFPLIFPA